MARSDAQPSSPRAQKRARATPSSRYLIPLATAALLGICFLLYYLTYVQQRREYLLDRNFRVLATLGEQISETVANQNATLKSYVEAFEGNEFGETETPRPTYVRAGANPPGAPIDPANDYQKDPFQFRKDVSAFAPRLQHFAIRPLAGGKQVPATPGLVRRDGDSAFQLAVTGHDGHYQASATISMGDLSQSFSPSILGTFSDVLIADEKGLIVYQKQRIGPHFLKLSDIVLSLPTSGEAKTSDSGSRMPTEQFVPVELGGERYFVFLEPVIVDLNPGEGRNPALAQLLTLCGLTPARSFEWQTLAISYRGIIVFSSLFLLVCLSAPLLKFFYFNERMRLRITEVVLLPLLFVTLAASLTAVVLQTVYFTSRSDYTDTELDGLSQDMRRNIREEIQAMRNQLLAACKTPYLAADLASGDQVVRKNVLTAELQGKVDYPYFTNIFWTDKNGKERVKWSATANATPLIDVRMLPFFRSLEVGHHYFFLDGGDPFRLDSVLPPNQDNYVGVLAMRTSDCVRSDQHGYAFMSGRLLSLIDPYLPLGCGFALVDDTGQVLFHSDKYRNNRENFLLEASNNRELMASIYGHLNHRNFSLDYRGGEIRARVTSIPGVTQAPWSLIVYKDLRYAQTYDLEIITMAGALLVCYLGAPTLIVFFFYLLAQPNSVPSWLWPSESMRRTYGFEIEAGLVMMILSALLIFLRPMEESLYAAAAAGYATVLIVFWSTLAGRCGAAWGWIFRTIYWAFAVLAIALPILFGHWWWSMAIGLILFAAPVLFRADQLRGAERWGLGKLSDSSLYLVRSLVLITVVGILPPIGFFRNSTRLEDNLQIRAAQLDAAKTWNVRERAIEQATESGRRIPREREQGEHDQKAVGPINRCNESWDVYFSSYFGTEVHRDRPMSSVPSSAEQLGPTFLHLAHVLHYVYNDIGAETQGVLRNPGLPDSVFVSVQPEWQWQPLNNGRSSVRIHEGRDTASACGSLGQSDLVVSTARPPIRVGALANLFTWFGVTALMGLVLWRVLRKLFLFDLGEPISHNSEELAEILQGGHNVLVLTASRRDWRPELASSVKTVINIRALAREQDWGESFDMTQLPAHGVVVIEEFEWQLGDRASDGQRLILTEQILEQARQVILVSAVDPSPLLIEHCAADAGKQPARWAAALEQFGRINLANPPGWPLGAEIHKQCRVLWEECHRIPELFEIAEEIWRKGIASHTLAGEQIISEVGERAAHYYAREWGSCTQEEWFLLTGLARDGMVNPRNTSSLRQLLRRRLIIKDPQFRMVNESFRRFVLAQVSQPLREEWEAEAAGSGWGRFREPFATALMLVGLFLVSTQQGFLQTSAGLLTAAGGLVAALVKVIGAVQGRSA